MQRSATYRNQPVPVGWASQLPFCKTENRFETASEMMPCGVFQFPIRKWEGHPQSGRDQVERASRALIIGISGKLPSSHSTESHEWCLGLEGLRPAVSPGILPDVVTAESSGIG